MIESLIHSQLVCPDLEADYPRITHGQGVFVFDEHGKRYLDGSAGTAAVSNLGHGIEELAECLREQALKIATHPAHLFSSDVVEDYFDQLVAFAPEGMNKVWTVSSGTEAVESAIKLAYQYQQLRGHKDKHVVISRWGTYHGNTIFALDVGGLKTRRSFYETYMNNFPHIDPAFAYRHQPEGMSLEDYGRACAGQLEEAILEAGPDQVAAFIAEPVVAAALGAVVPPPNYFPLIRQICDKYDVLLIIDEVLAGFGRTGKNFAIEHFGVVPDIIASAKGISSGFYPLSAVIAHHKVTDELERHKQHFFSGHTYACAPLGAAVGRKVLEYMAEHKVVENAAQRGEELRAHFLKLKEKYAIIGDVRGLGLLRAIEFVQDRDSKAPFPDDWQIAKRVVQKCLNKGVILYGIKGSVDYQHGDHILITPPLTIQSSELHLIVEALDQSIAELTAEIGHASGHDA